MKRHHFPVHTGKANLECIFLEIAAGTMNEVPERKVLVKLHFATLAGKVGSIDSNDLKSHEVVSSQFKFIRRLRRQ